MSSFCFLCFKFCPKNTRITQFFFLPFLREISVNKLKIFTVNVKTNQRGKIRFFNKSLFIPRQSIKLNMCILLVVVVLTVIQTKPLYGSGEAFPHLHSPSWLLRQPLDFVLLFSLWEEIHSHTSITQIRLNKSLSVLLKSPNSLRWFFHLFFRPYLGSEIKISQSVKCHVFSFRTVLSQAFFRDVEREVEAAGRPMRSTSRQGQGFSYVKVFQSKNFTLNIC